MQWVDDEVIQNSETDNTFFLFGFPIVSVDFLDKVEVSFGSSFTEEDATEPSLSTYVCATSGCSSIYKYCKELSINWKMQQLLKVYLILNLL